MNRFIDADAAPVVFMVVCLLIFAVLIGAYTLIGKAIDSGADAKFCPYCGERIVIENAEIH